MVRKQTAITNNGDMHSVCLLLVCMYWYVHLLCVQCAVQQQVCRFRTQANSDCMRCCCARTGTSVSGYCLPVGEGGLYSTVLQQYIPTYRLI